MSEIVCYLVMLMALGNTVVGAYILCIQPADDHSLVFPHREERLAFFKAAAAGKKHDRRERKSDERVKSMQNRFLLIHYITIAAGAYSVFSYSFSGGVYESLDNRIQAGFYLFGSTDFYYPAVVDHCQPV